MFRRKKLIFIIDHLVLMK